ncbi:hypothetical protein EV356DRAFT_498502 [Viridothelium virens]|uniref:Aminoglycoside phosphotransferase domain-containing protein n=1 Tax=Viridothelium virens TaxID=1048519 RepID=A0A6A6HEW1_VIRVR|nr:hypothetical protein EV356DRAFT_498502 [Viridothelium virens]
MERIQGETLESKWSSMDQATKEVVVSKLRPVFEEMRKLISPGGYCAICHRGLKDDFFWTQEPDDPDHPFVGPFDTESSLNDAMVRTCFNTSARKHSADFYSRALEAALHDHPPTFSHGDIQRKNIMIRSVGGSSSQTKQPVEAEIEIVLIDWEIAEWYPSYWDYAKAMYAAARLDDDWRFWLEKFLEPYYNGFAWQYLLGMQCMGC